MSRLLNLVAGMVVAAVCATGCGSATLVQDGGAGAGGNGAGGQGGMAGHAPTGTGGSAGAGGKVGTDGGAGAGGKVGTGGEAGGTAGTTGSGGGAGGATGSGGMAGAGGAGTGGTAGSKTADGNSCSSNLVCQSGNCSTYAVSGASICCAAGNSNCGTCVSEQTDNANCGACGTKCSANRSCQSGGCACQGYTLPSSCGGCGSWSFESGTAEGWAKDTDPNFPLNGGGNNGATNFVATTSQKHDGTYALAVPILVDVTSTFLASTAVPLCANGSTIAVGGYTMTAWVMVHDGAGSTLGALDDLFLSAWGPSGAENEPVVFGGANIPIDTWFQVSFTFNSATQADHIAIYLTPNENWQGTLYIDSVTLTGP